MYTKHFTRAHERHEFLLNIIYANFILSSIGPYCMQVVDLDFVVYGGLQKENRLWYTAHTYLIHHLYFSITTSSKNLKKTFKG